MGLTSIYRDKEVKTSNMTLGLLFYCWLHVSAFVENLRQPVYRGADKSLARPERKQANVSVRMA